MIFLVSSSQIPIPPKKGGAVEKLLFGLYKELKDKFDIKIVSCCENGKHDYVIVPSIKLPYPWSLIYELLWGIKVSFVLARLKPRLVHFNIPFNALSILAIRFLYPKTKFVYTSHNPSWTVPESELGILNRIIEKLEVWIMRRVDAVVAVSCAVKRGLIERARIPQDKVEVIYNFVDIEKFKPEYGDSWKRVRGIKKMVLFVGKLTELKGVPNLINAIPKVLENHPETVFVFVGGSYYGRKNNPYEDIVDKLGIKEHVIFTGPVSEDELLRIYSSADVFVLPTKRESYGLVIMEALSSGVPVAVSEIEPLTEIVDKKCGLFFDRNDIGDIAKKISMLLDMKFDKNEIRKCATKFSLHIASRKYSSLYEAVINGEDISNHPDIQ